MNIQRSAFLVRLGLTLRRILLSLADLVVPAPYALFERSLGVAHTMMLRVVSELKISDIIENERLSSEALAERVGANADVLRRILRALASRGIYRFRKDQTLAPTRLSRTLLSSRFEANKDWTQYFGSESNMRAWSDLMRSARDGQSAFDRMHGMTVWEWFELHPQEEEQFARSMMGVTRLQVPVILSLYDFSSFGTLCDIGGGRGTLLAEILLRYPRLKATLFDAPGVLVSAERLLADKGLSSRVERIAGNFFLSIPEGRDGYLLKNILHDWGDDICLKILQTIRLSMRPDQKLLVIEQLIGDHEINPIASFSDIQMLVACSGGRERSESELKALLAQAGFQTLSVRSHPIVSLLECEILDPNPQTST